MVSLNSGAVGPRSERGPDPTRVRAMCVPHATHTNGALWSLVRSPSARSTRTVTLALLLRPDTLLPTGLRTIAAAASARPSAPAPSPAMLACRTFSITDIHLRRSLSLAAASQYSGWPSLATTNPLAIADTAPTRVSLVMLMDPRTGSPADLSASLTK